MVIIAFNPNFETKNQNQENNIVNEKENENEKEEKNNPSPDTVPVYTNNDRSIFFSFLPYQ